MIKLLKKRRSIRTYLDKVVEKEKIDEILKSALLSPSSRSRLPWEFIFVDNRELLERLAKSKLHGSEFLKTAPCAIVVVGDSSKSDVWVEDASIAAILIQLAAEKLDLASCWIQIRKRMHTRSKNSEIYVKELLGVPDYLNIECIISLGYKAEKKEAYREEDLKVEKLHKNSFDNRYEI